MSVIQGNDLIALVTGGSLEDFTSSAPPVAPVITGTVDGGDGSSAVISITGTDTIRLYYRLLYATSWTTGLTRSASGDITQTGLSSGKVYEFYCVADDGSVVSSPSVIVTQRISGTAAKDTALGASVLSILASYLINDLSLMTEPSAGNNWPLYNANIPDDRNVKTDCGGIYDTTGILDGKLSNGEVVEHPGIQILIRSNNYETAFAKIEAIALALDDVSWVTVVVNSVSYVLQNISRTSPITPLGPEKGNIRRFLFTVNFLVSLKKV